MTNAKKVDILKSPITVDAIAQGQFPKAGELTAQLRQVVTKVSIYDGKRVSNEMAGGLFSAAEFGGEFKDKVYSKDEVRIAWISVPATITVAEVLTRLAATPDACIYRVLSNEPILSKDQQWSITQQFKTKDYYAEQQVMRHGENSKTPGRLMLVDGKPCYRKTFFWPTTRADEDLRKGEFYTTPKITLEMEELSKIGVASFSGEEVEHEG